MINLKEILAQSVIDKLYEYNERYESKVIIDTNPPK